MRHLVSVNTWPESQICSDCPLRGGLVNPGIYGDAAYVCSQGHEAASCKIPDMLAGAPQSLQTALPKATVAAALSAHRKAGAKKDCRLCRGTGEIISPDLSRTACQCTKPQV